MKLKRISRSCRTLLGGNRTASQIVGVIPGNNQPPPRCTGHRILIHRCLFNCVCVEHFYVRTGHPTLNQTNRGHVLLETHRPSGPNARIDPSGSSWGASCPSFGSTPISSGTAGPAWHPRGSTGMCWRLPPIEVPRFVSGFTRCLPFSQVLSTGCPGALTLEQPNRPAVEFHKAQTTGYPASRIRQ